METKSGLGEFALALCYAYHTDRERNLSVKK